MTTDLTSDARTRAGLYGLLSEAFTYPSAELAQRIAISEWAAALAALVPAGTDVPAPVDPSLRALSMSYMETFELPAGSACPLYTGIYARQRKEAMEELLRFYRHFGLTLSEDPRDLPDSVPTVLEFLQFLAWRQGREDAAAAASLQAAERDVIQRHLLPWAQTTDQRLAERSGEFYPRLVQLLASVCEARLS